MSWLPPGPAMLFCPADRPERYAKAAERADVVILDLEDALTPAARPAGREAVSASTLDPAQTIVRVNAVGTDDHEPDLTAVAEAGYGIVMLAKTESVEQVRALGARGLEVLALVETPLGVLRAAQIAAEPGCAGLMWGAEDLVAGMGGSSSRFAADEADLGRTPHAYRDVPRYARSAVALAAAAFGKWAVDCVHFDITDTAGQRAEAVDAVALGYAGTVCIHPSQVPVVREAYAPSAEQVIWARRVLDAATTNPGVFQLDGRMIDAPVFRQAEAVLRRAGPPH